MQETRPTHSAAGRRRLVGPSCAACAAAFAAALAPVHAEPSVTMSGFLDIGAYRGFDRTEQVGTIKRSHLTFSGRENLGGGLAATFRLQTRFEADTGSTETTGKPFWHGESTVGLQGSFGHLRFGRALDVVSNNDWAFDPWDNFDRIASPAWNNWHWNYASDRTSNSGGAEYGRLSNGIFYDSPALGGLRVHFSGAFEDSPGPDGGTGNNTGLALGWSDGAIGALLAASRNSSDDEVQFLGLRMVHGAWTFMGAYDRSVYDAPAGDSTAKVLSAGLRYAIGTKTLKAGYAHRDVDGTDTDFVGLGVDYALSKRTSVYLSLGRNDTDGASARTAYGIGISHGF